MFKRGSPNFARCMGARRCFVDLLTASLFNLFCLGLHRTRNKWLRILCFPCAETTGRLELSPCTCQVLLRTCSTILAQHPCYSLGACTSAFADGEGALASLQVFSKLASPELEGKNTFSLDHRKQVRRNFMDPQI